MQKKVPGFSLIETALVLVIIGLLISGILKGRDILETAKINATALQIQHLRLNLQTFRESQHQWPGHQAHLGDSPFAELNALGLCDSPLPPETKIGGKLTLQEDPDHTLWIVLSNGERAGILTPQQAQSLKTKLGEDVVFSGAGCLQGQSLDFKTKKPVCLVHVKV